MNVYEAVAGADLGNDSLKLVINPDEPVTVRNTVARRLLDEKRMDLSYDSATRRKNREIDGLDVIVEEHGQQPYRYYIGNLAVKAGESKVEVGTPKADNPYIHIPLLAMLANAVPEEIEEARYKIVVGLPIKQFADKDNGYRKKMKERLIGTYTVTLLDERKQRKVTVIIEDVTVTPEGVPVLINQMLNKFATGFARQELGTGSYGIVDVGAFTTDCPVIEDGKPDSFASTGEDEGIASYLDRIADGLKSKYRAEITRNQLVERIEKKDYTMYIRGKQVDLKPDFDAALNEFASRIIGIIDRLWQKNYQIREFFVVGGGSKALEPFLQKQIKSREDISLTFVYRKDKDDHQNDPQLQNAYGYWKIAKQKYGG